MGQSHVRNLIHIVFSTKNQRRFLKFEFEEEIFKYISGICRNHDSPAIAIGAHLDHIHILCNLSKNIALSHLLKELKASSSKWIKTLDKRLSEFYWQDGYGAFSVNPREVDIVINYIKNQHIRHKTKSFKEEYIAFLDQYNINYDENYLW